MDIRLVYLVLVSMVTARNIEHDFGEHLERMVRSEDIDGYSMAALHAVDEATGRLTGQSKRDIQAHASDSTSAKSDFSLHLTSGERVRMSLKRSSVDTSAATVIEVKEDGKRERVKLQARDCFFAGPLQRQKGFASLSMCDGRLMGSINTEKRAYELHPLPDAVDKRSADEIVHVLVTWQNTGLAPLKREIDEADPNDGTETDSDEDEDDEPELIADEDDDMTGDALKREMDETVSVGGAEILEAEEDTDEPELIEDDGEIETRSVEDRTAVVEIADFLDSYYLDGLKRKLGITETDDIITHFFNKWSASAYVLSDPEWVTWNITLKMVTLEIWRTNPDWYATNGSHSLGQRMKLICNHNKSWPYDHMTLHTGKPMSGNRRVVGLAWVRGACRKRFRCSAVKSIRNGLGAELHELGHNLGLKHEKADKFCVGEEATEEDPLRGFMGGNKTHFRRCYRHTFDKYFKTKSKRCLFQLNAPDTLNWDFTWD